MVSELDPFTPPSLGATAEADPMADSLLDPWELERMPGPEVAFRVERLFDRSAKVEENIHIAANSQAQAAAKSELHDLLAPGYDALMKSGRYFWAAAIADKMHYYGVGSREDLVLALKNALSDDPNNQTIADRLDALAETGQRAA